MKILHVMDHSLPRTDGYTIRAKYMLEAQVGAGHEVTVLTSPSQGGNASDASINGVHYCRSQYNKYEKFDVARGAKQLVFGSAIAHAMKNLMAHEQFDLIHAHTPFTIARVALTEARKHKLPFVYEKRNLWEESARARGKTSGKWPFYQIARAMDRWVSVRADAICTITQALRANTIALGAAADRVFVVGNGVDVDAFKPQAASSEISEIRARCAGNIENAFVIGFIGSFFLFEGLPLLIEAFAELSPKYPCARLVLVGDGEDRQQVDQLIAKLALSDRAWVVGSVPHTTVLDYYAAMDALVYPRYPSMLTNMISPLKPLEPMAMARCVIGSNVGGIAELINNGETGLLFEAGSRSALIEVLEKLLCGKIDAAQLGARARAHVVANRQWRNMSATYEPAYARAHNRQ